jgi:hypothetical protein
MLWFYADCVGIRGKIHVPDRLREDSDAEKLLKHLVFIVTWKPNLNICMD